MNTFSPSPRAIREDKVIAEKFKTRRAKALERYLVEQEVLAAKRARHITQHKSPSYTGAMGMYIIDTEEEKILTDISEETGEKKKGKSYLPEIKDNMMNIVIRFFKRMYGDTDFVLTWKQFMAINACLQLTLPCAVRHIDLVSKWGALPVIILHMIVCICIGMPIYMIVMFLGNYSRRCYIRIWEFVPALKGVAYGVIMLSIQHEIYNVFIVALSLSYILAILTSDRLPWEKCQFSGSHSDCYSLPTFNYNRRCCLKTDSDCDYDHWGGTVFKHASYDYLMSYQLGMKYNSATDSKAGTPFIFYVYVGVLWICVFFALMVGLKRLRKVLPMINIIITGIMYCPIVALTVYYGDQEIFPTLRANYTKISDMEFLNEIASHALHREYTGDIITYSALATPGISIGVDTVCIYTLKQLSILLLTVWVSMGGSMLKRHYHVRNPNCVDTGGYAILFAVIPDLITRLFWPKFLMLCHYTMIFLWGFCGTVYTMFSLIGSLMDEYPTLTKYKAFVCGSICAMTCACNLLMMYVRPSATYASWLSYSYEQTKVFLIFCTALGVFCYSLKRLASDYHFTYGVKINVFWISGVKVATLVITALMIFNFFHSFYTKTVAFADVAATILTLFPVLGGAAAVFVRFKSGLKKTFITPDPQWGPASYSKRISRNRFDPKRALRYKSSSVHCTHSCLINSRLLDKEVWYWNEKCYEQHHIRVE